MRNKVYEEYLASDEWKLKREVAARRALGRCEFCGSAMKHVHHIRYPKRLGDEPLSDLIAVCKPCHDKSHGMREMNLEPVPDPRVVEVRPPTGGKFLVCASINGNAYASLDAWAENLRVPAFRMGHFEATIEGILVGANAPGRLPQARYNSARVVSWQVIAEALRATDRKYFTLKKDGPQKHNFTPDEWRQMCAFVDRIDEVTRWGWDMQSQALAGRIQASAMPPAPAQIPEDIAHLFRTLGNKAVEHDGRITEHDGRIEKIEERIEAIQTRDPRDWLTVHQALVELALDASQLVRGGQTLADVVGGGLRSDNCEKGAQTQRRLEGSSVRVQVNQWRRGDVYRVIGIVLQRDFSHLLIDDPSAGTGGLPLFNG
ncbi:MAG: HNH endonuclease [Burkholderiaceae bacterium]|nr:HNH endonuclease [Burkholderiaceae bacterium]